LPRILEPGADIFFFLIQADLASSGGSTHSSQPRPRPRPLPKNSGPSNAYWDDPEFFRRRMSGSLSRASSVRSIRSSPPPPDVQGGFHHGLDGDVPPRNTVGAQSNDASDEEDVVDMCDTNQGVCFSIICFSCLFIVIIPDESSSGSDYSADERKRKNAEQKKYEERVKVAKAIGAPLPPSPENSDSDRISSHSPLPNSSIPPSSPDINSPPPSLKSAGSLEARVAATLAQRLSNLSPRRYLDGHLPWNNLAPPAQRHPTPCSSPMRPESPPRLTAAQKGKAPQQRHSVRDGPLEVDLDVEPTEEEHVTAQKKRGPMPKVAWDKARELGQRILTAADQLAREFGKSRRDILIAAGLGITTSHKKRNHANTYRSWYWNTKKIPSDSASSLLRNHSMLTLS
jgi:hypothetical protein